VSVVAPLDVHDSAWSWALPFAPASARAARAHVSVALGSEHVDAQVIEDARVVVSELVGNALRHARPLPHGMLRVDLEIGSTDLRLGVADGGSATLPTLLTPATMSLGGRGLSIVRMLTRHWGVSETRQGNVVFGILDRA